VKKRLFIIDGSSLMYRAFHAIPATLTSPGGLPTNAVYGFTQTVRKILKEFDPEYIGVAFDMKGPTFRHEIYEEYKADRPAMPDILGEQIPYIKRMLRAMKIPVLEKQSYEADDIIAVVVKEAKGAKLKSFVITGDKDMYQLVGEDTVIFDYNKDKELGSPEVVEKFGVPPGCIRDLLALAGDPSDGIPGVPGVGLKTAAKLLSEYGSIEDIYNTSIR
jgi:DNA polymerase-1